MKKIKFASDLVFDLLSEEKSGLFWLGGSLFLIGFLELIQGKNIFLPFYGALLGINSILIGDLFIAFYNKLFPKIKFYLLLFLSISIHFLFLFMYPKASEALLIIDTISTIVAVIFSVAIMLKMWWIK